MDNSIEALLQMVQMLQQMKAQTQDAEDDNADIPVYEVPPVEPPDGHDWRLHFLTSLRPYLPERNRMLVDIVIKCAEINAIMIKMR